MLCAVTIGSHCRNARTLLRLKDGGTIGLDSTPPTNERVLGDDTPIVVVLHGLTGGAHLALVFYTDSMGPMLITAARFS